jgi:hypothetical protein
MRDLLERQCLQYQLTGTETLGKGPLVVALDKSGSMDGPRDIWATALALALLDQAQRENRMFALLLFDAGVKYEAIVKPAEPLPELALLQGCAGGTSIEAALARALKIIETHPGALRKGDVVLVPDGASDTATAIEVRQAAERLNVTILGLGVGVSLDALAPWSATSTRSRTSPAWTRRLRRASSQRELARSRKHRSARWRYPLQRASSGGGDWHTGRLRRMADQETRGGAEWKASGLTSTVFRAWTSGTAELGQRPSAKRERRARWALSPPDARVLRAVGGRVRCEPSPHRRTPSGIAIDYDQPHA